MSKCTDEIWLESVVRDAVAEWLVNAEIINDQADLEVSSVWGDYEISNAVLFDQVCNGVIPCINRRLEAARCRKFAGIPQGQWRLSHRPKTIALFISDVAGLILSPASTS